MGAPPPPAADYAYGAQGTVNPWAPLAPGAGNAGGAQTVYPQGYADPNQPQPAQTPGSGVIQPYFSPPPW